jgi:hydrogenase-4 component E
MALVGLWVCVIGRDAVGQILGFLMLENGIFALGLLAAYGLPGLVEAGVFLDVLVVVLVTEGLVMQIRQRHASLDVNVLGELRG